MDGDTTIQISRAAALKLYIARVLGHPMPDDEVLKTFMNREFSETAYDVRIARASEPNDDHMLHLILKADDEEDEVDDR